MSLTPPVTKLHLQRTSSLQSLSSVSFLSSLFSSAPPSRVLPCRPLHASPFQPDTLPPTCRSCVLAGAALTCGRGLLPASPEVTRPFSLRPGPPPSRPTPLLP
ncbi:hypothetical protein E2C01_096905 [Portunus trituberculatus]|uniref:Uncharacterized protein n=1 Tax=Portunus trituberculatus TaxID=210409 RepID=A0A5B7JTR7_PORTR|nr:hypothetical protein [Portunus trituberculatus]